MPPIKQGWVSIPPLEKAVRAPLNGSARSRPVGETLCWREHPRTSRATGSACLALLGRPERLAQHRIKLDENIIHFTVLVVAAPAGLLRKGARAVERLAA